LALRGAADIVVARYAPRAFAERVHALFTNACCVTAITFGASARPLLWRRRIHRWRLSVAHLDNKKGLLERANTVLLLGILWSALAVCVIGALSYDMANWFAAW
jgi:membrane protein YdbS with pleckstrin-like domain